MLWCVAEVLWCIVHNVFMQGTVNGHWIISNFWPTVWLEASLFVCWCTCARLSRGCVSRRQTAVCDLLCSMSLSVWVLFHADACTSGHRTRQLLRSAVGHTDLKHRILGLASGPVIKTPSFQWRRRGCNPWWGNYIPLCRKKKKKRIKQNPSSKCYTPSSKSYT